jgi:hypothetical protein
MHTCILVADQRNIYEVLDRFASYDDDPPKPEAKWDYFGIGGRFNGRLLLKRPRIRRFLGWIPVGWSLRASVAKKCEIDQEALLKSPPAALFLRDTLYQCPVFPTEEAAARWDAEFRERFAEIPDDTILQIVDAHS